MSEDYKKMFEDAGSTISYNPDLVITVEPQMLDITFSNGSLVLKANGDILIYGRLAENDKAVVDALRKVLGLA